jgi:uncharacterized membrane protein
MNFYQVSLALHTIVAVLGIGTVFALFVLSGEAQKGGDRGSTTLALMGRLNRVVGISLGLMLLTGLSVMVPTRGAFAANWWFRVAFILFIVLGAFNGQLQRAVRVASGPASQASTAAVARLRTLTSIMVGLVIVIVTLMAAKPF